MFHDQEKFAPGARQGQRIGQGKRRTCWEDLDRLDRGSSS